MKKEKINVVLPTKEMRNSMREFEESEAKRLGLSLSEYYSILKKYYSILKKFNSFKLS